MKIAFLTALMGCCYISAFCQNSDAGERQAFIKQIRTAAAQHPTPQGTYSNTPGPGIKIPANLLLKQAGGKQVVKQQQVKNNTAAKKTKTKKKVLRANGPPPCEDTSYRRLMGVHNGFLFVQSVSQCTDGGLFVSAMMHDSTALPNPWWKAYGLLIKLDADGNVVWLKQFEDLSVDMSWFFVMRAIELPNHDIICAGLLNTDLNTDRYKTMVYRLTPDGNIIWQNCLRSDIGIFNSPTGSFTYWIETAAEGLNGDVILCGTTNSNLSSGKIETVVRLNNQGQLVWDANYGNHGYDGSYLFGAEGVSAFVQNGQVILVGLSHGTNNPPVSPAVNFLTLDYSNGNLLAKRFFRPDYPDYLEEFGKGFTYWANKFVRLSNGHFLFYGKLFSDFMHTSPTKDYFGVIEFDASFNLVKSYTISSDLTTNYSNNTLYFDSSGKAVVAVLEYLDSYEANVFFGAFSNQQFQNQRKAHYAGVGLPGSSGFAFLSDNAYAYVQSYFEDQPTTKSYFEFKKMHNSDTSSLCLGKDTMLFHFLPLNIIEDPDYYLLDPNEPNKMVALPQQISLTDTTSTSSLNPCKQTNYCDTIKIHGNPVICGNSPSITFTAFKNKECGAFVQWNIDSNAIDSLEVLSDSSVKIWFKNINWQGKLYASLPAGKCYLPAVDSITVSIIRAEVQVNLGADTVLCSGNSMVLHAGKSFSAYEWQDGSTDSVLTVVVPGIYWVHTSDFCGNNFDDTITISPFNISINIGPDRTKCNNDTLHLDAPAGFMRYTWANNYNISSTTSQHVIVSPTVDTAYCLQVEKSPGCFAYDTIRVKVNLSLPIDLGGDQSFCSGESIVMNAGAGFTQYQWSNGSSQQQILVDMPGAYSIIGTAANGCKSNDTLIVNVWSNPIVTLNDDPELCTGSTRRLDAGIHSAYLWQDGSLSSSFVVSDTGTYYVRVTDNNQCSSSDTVHITQLLPMPANFLPVDTAICNYGTLLIQSTGSYTNYTWNNNASSPSINITAPGIYWLQVTDASNCTGKDSILVNLKECLEGFYIPNAFTPDRNGRNDYFKPFIGGVVKQYQFTIYNRWGEVVFTTKDRYKGWDGIFGGAAQDTNVFTWMCTYQLEGETVKNERGTVVLIR